MFYCGVEDASLILISSNNHETWSFILNFCKQIWGWKGRHSYGRPRAALSNATPLALSLLTIRWTSLITTKFGERGKVQEEIWRGKPLDDLHIAAVFFDGRKDLTLAKEKVEDKWYSNKRREDPYVVIGEPGTIYLDHLSLQHGTGAAIADGLDIAIKAMGIADNLIAIGADSTAVNIGHKNGAVHLLECRLGRTLHWFVCNLHNELPLRHLCKHLIGPTESSTNWKGPVGNALATCESLPLSSTGIRCIPDGATLPDIDLVDLSRDQTSLYKMIKAIKTGLISSDLLREKPGPMSHARWLTIAGRICRIYVATEESSDELYSLTLFIVCYYGPMWFEIKKRAWCTDGAIHLLQMIKLL